MNTKKSIKKHVREHIILQPSTRANKKFDAILDDGTKVSFGAKGY